MRDLLRFNTSGDVDNGKSTLIGRLLFDSGGLPKDVIASVAKRATGTGDAKSVNLASFTDGLKAERAQGITIDASYRYFTRGGRDFIVADTPGHFEYTRNMMTATSHSDVTLILIDATKGIVEQNKRHAYIASRVGVQNLMVVVNKMDVSNFSQERFNALVKEFTVFVDKLGTVNPVFIPISALHGDNVVTKSANMPWYKGSSILQYLERVEVKRDSPVKDLRFIVHWIEGLDRGEYRARELVGQVVSGELRRGEHVLVLPSMSRRKVLQVTEAGESKGEAKAPSISRILLSKRADISPGDILSEDAASLRISDTVEAEICWMDKEAVRTGKRFLLQRGPAGISVTLKKIRSKVDVLTLEHEENVSEIRQNDIAHVELKADSAIPWDTFSKNRWTGSFILIDQKSKRTAAAGVVNLVKEASE